MSLSFTYFEAEDRLLVLNSYENRVYQVGMEDGPPLIAKFYRPGRWQDAQILEEHAFACQLQDAEIPVVAPLAFAGQTLLQWQGFRFALFPRRGGRAAGATAWLTKPLQPPLLLKAVNALLRQ